ncbi:MULTISPECIES: hypothetical protein, partial [Streptomyces]|uniref:hypothetical protein n=1 Tax=Streptomyces TaxID=1883 RepID=UPI001AE077A4
MLKHRGVLVGPFASGLLGVGTAPEAARQRERGAVLGERLGLARRHMPERRQRRRRPTVTSPRTNGGGTRLGR